MDFEQGVNSAIKQVREALGEDADRPLYVETVPSTLLPRTDVALHKAMWLNIAELRLAESGGSSGSSD